LGFVGFWALLGFSDFLFEQAVEKLVGLFSSSVKHLFRFVSTFRLSRNSQIHCLL